MPCLTDTGQIVTLDLHGARVDEALRLAQRTLALARQRGRRRLELVHGTSTSDAYGQRRTIKHALHEWLDDGGGGTAQVQRGESSLILYLDLSAAEHPARLSLREVWR